MTPTAKVLLILVGAIAVIFAWIMRFDTKPTAVIASGAIVTDRWTGHVYSCVAGSPCRQLFPSN